MYIFLKHLMLQWRDLSQGREFVSLKELRKWDELVDTVDSGFIEMSTVEGYIQRLNTPNDRINLNEFKKFMAMMDQILVDESGNILSLDDADKAINLDELDYDEDDEDDSRL